VQALAAQLLGTLLALASLAWGEQVALLLQRLVQKWRDGGGSDASVNGQQQSHSAAATAGSEHSLWPAAVVDGMAALLLIGFSTACIVLAVLYRARSELYVFLAVLFGPFGCLLRWRLSHANGKLPGKWAWFPAGTYAANTAACAIDFVMAAIALRVPLRRQSAEVLQAVIVGISAALSTVSTWAVEVRRRPGGALSLSVSSCRFSQCQLVLRLQACGVRTFCE
jgi:fluoride ion exporter CrcB/FEX